MTPADVVVVPSAPALLPEYAGLADPVAEVRMACHRAVAWLVERHPDRITVLSPGPRPDNVARGASTPAGPRVARHLLAQVGFTGTVVTDGAVLPDGGVLAVANGSAKRTEKAPGHLDERSLDLDAAIGRCLHEGDVAALRDLDEALAEELWAFDAPVLRTVGGLVRRPSDVVVDFDGDPFGVQYWVVRWSCGS
jgi:hypothetical protein